MTDPTTTPEAPAPVIAQPTPMPVVPARPAAVEWTKGIMFQYVGSLLMEQNGTAGRYVMSIGRVALLMVLAQSMWVWHSTGADITGSMKEVLFSLLAYNFGTKGANIAKDAIDAWKAGKAPEQQ
jgi:hypothetical protein